MWSQSSSPCFRKNGIQCDYINFSPNDPETLEALGYWIRAFQTRKKLSQTKIAVIGQHPDGFHTCAFDSEKLNEISGVKVEQMELDDLFDEAERIEQKTVNLIRNELDSKIDGIELVEQEPLEKVFVSCQHLEKKLRMRVFRDFQFVAGQSFLLSTVVPPAEQWVF